VFSTDSLEEKAEFLRKSLTRVVLKDVLEKVTVKESFRLKGQHVRVYKLHFHYLPRRAYSSFTNLKARHIMRYVGGPFLAKLHAMLKKNAKDSYSDADLILDKQTSTTKREHEDEDGGNEASVSILCPKIW
jgi:DNA-directed RNA polymerase I subunit RPA1